MLKKLGIRLRAPSGFCIKIQTNYYGDILINLYKRYKTYDRKIGNVRLAYEGNNVYATHSDLNFKYRNKKLGALMYSKAIEWCLKRGYKCKSSGYSSDNAQRVWVGKTIRKYFHIRNEPTYSGSTAQTWFASPKKFKVVKNTKNTAKRKVNRLR